MAEPSNAPVSSPGPSAGAPTRNATCRAVRIAHLSTVHRAEDSRIFVKEAQTLADAGYEVHVVGVDPSASDRDGIRLHAIEKPVRGGRVRRYWSRVRQIYPIATSLDADVYHFHDSELIPVGLALRARGAVVVYDVHEDRPRQAISLERGRPVWGMFKYAANALLEGAARRLLDGFICATPTIERRFAGSRAVLARNFPRLDEFPADELRRIAYADRPDTIIYVGSIFAARGIREMVEAIGALPAELDARLRVAGEFTSRALREEVDRLPGSRHIDFLGWQDRAGVARELSRARVALVVLHPTPAYLDAYPVKLFEYMAAGLPVVASDFPLWRRIVDGAGCGLLVDPRRPDRIAEAIAHLLSHPEEADAMGRRGREAVEAKYNWDVESGKLLRFYERLSPARRRRKMSGAHRRERA